MIRQARHTDIEKIMPLIQRAVAVMHAQGSYQWDETYPRASDYQKDITRGELYLYIESEVVLGVCTISKRGHEEYPLIQWSTKAEGWTLKRLAVDPEQRGAGIADQFFQFAEVLAKENNVYYLNTDTFSENHHAQKLFIRNGFSFVQARKDDRNNLELFYFEKLFGN